MSVQNGILVFGAAVSVLCIHECIAAYIVHPPGSPKEVVGSISVEDLDSVDSGYQADMDPSYPEFPYSNAHCDRIPTAVDYDRIFRTLVKFYNATYANIFHNLRLNQRKEIDLFFGKYLQIVEQLYNITIRADFEGLTEDVLHLYNLTFRADFLSGGGASEGHLHNFITDAFAFLIKPFFNIGIEILTQIVYIFEKVLDNLSDEVEKMVDVLLRFIEYVVTLLRRIVVLIESKYMLFEFTSLYVLVLVLTKSNVISTLVVILTALLFGVERSGGNDSVFTT